MNYSTIGLEVSQLVIPPIYAPLLRVPKLIVQLQQTRAVRAAKVLGFERVLNPLGCEVKLSVAVLVALFVKAQLVGDVLVDAGSQRPAHVNVDVA